MLDIGTKIAILRKQNGWSQNELAEKINCSRATLINYEGNKNTPSIETAVKLAEVFNVSLDYLVGKGQNAKFDKKTLSRLNDIESMKPDFKNHLFHVIDAFIRDYKTGQAYTH